MGAGRACYESVNIAFELHLVDAWRLEVKLAEQREQHHGSDRAEEEQSRRMCRLRFSIMVCATPMGGSRLNCPP